MSDNEEYFCYECSKKYPDFNKYQTHIKIKHQENKPQPKEKKTAEPPTSELEDKLYTFFGQLSEKYIDKASEQMSSSEAHRFLGLANYQTNQICRTPYENEIKIMEEIPSDFEFKPMTETEFSQSQVDQIIREINEQISLLISKLDLERNKWEFRDPLDHSLDAEDQFSIMNVGKLLENYPKRKINLRYKEITVFLVWIGRICKSEAFKIFYRILVSYALVYYDFLEQAYEAPSQSKDLHSWKFFINKNKKEAEELEKGRLEKGEAPNLQNVIRTFQVDKPEEIDVSKEDYVRLIEFYEKWVEGMGAICKGVHAREPKTQKKWKIEERQQSKVKAEQK